MNFLPSFVSIIILTLLSSLLFINDLYNLGASFFNDLIPIPRNESFALCFDQLVYLVELIVNLLVLFDQEAVMPKCLCVLD